MKRNTNTPRTQGSKSSGRSQTVKRDAQTALATTLKIDAIESEMSSEFVNITTIQPADTRSGPKTAAPPPPKANKPGEPSAPLPRVEPKRPAKPAPAVTLQPMAAEMGATTEFLLDGQTAVANIAAPSSEAATVIEEAAIMYANGQTELVEQMLRAAVEEDLLGSVTLNAWQMLFDLYQISGKRQEFEHLSIAYANKFETSPPAWLVGTQEVQQTAAPAGAKPMVTFSGALDSRSAKYIERIQKLAESHQALRLEFARITEVDPAGCALLLGVLNKLQKSGHDLILVGAPELADKIRTIVEVGRRDDTEDPWLLLLEILRLLNREKEFEETSIDYCVTFEVSPPAFVAPQNKVTTATAETPVSAPALDGFMMPALIEGSIDNLILAIAAYSDEHCPAVIDCSQLIRVDFNAAGSLLTELAPFCGSGKAVEFHHVNHLVTELFKVIGLKDLVRIVPRKNY